MSQPLQWTLLLANVTWLKGWLRINTHTLRAWRSDILSDVHKELVSVRKCVRARACVYTCISMYVGEGDGKKFWELILLKNTQNINKVCKRTFNKMDAASNWEWKKNSAMFVKGNPFRGHGWQFTLVDREVMDSKRGLDMKRLCPRKLAITRDVNSSSAGQFSISHLPNLEKFWRSAHAHAHILPFLHHTTHSNNLHLSMKPGQRGNLMILVDDVFTCFFWRSDQCPPLELSFSHTHILSLSPSIIQLSLSLPDPHPSSKTGKYWILKEKKKIVDGSSHHLLLLKPPSVPTHPAPSSSGDQS